MQLDKACYWVERIFRKNEFDEHYHEAANALLGHVNELQARNAVLERRINMALSGEDESGEPHGGRTEHFEFMEEALAGVHDEEE